MKKLSLLLLSFALYASVWAQDVITFEWEVDVDMNEKSLDISATNGKLFTVNWGDGSIKTYIGNGDENIHLNKTYSIPRTYTVTITASTIDCRFFLFICSDNHVVNLHMDQCTELRYLNCGGNNLNALDVSGCISLGVLFCSYNPLNSLNVRGCTQLEQLYCSNCQLSNLDLSEYASLFLLYVSNNWLSSLDLTSNTALTDLDCSNNLLTNLDVENNIALRSLGCSNNQLNSLNLTSNTTLTGLDCSNNLLTNLDVGNNIALGSLSCSNNQLNSLDLTSNTALTDLDCSNNLLTNLDVGNNIALQHLSCSNNQLNSLDLISNTALIILNCYNNQIINLDLSTNTRISRLVCRNNPELNNLNLNNTYKLDILLIENCTALETLDCSNNKLRILYADGCTSLKYLDCSHNLLTSQELRLSNTTLQYLDCSYNRITSCPFGTRLTTLYCNNNGDIYDGTVRLQSALSYNPLLHTLDCSSNVLYELDFSNNPKLQYLNCSGSVLVELNLSNNLELQYLDCSSCNILGSLSLDLSNNLELQYLKCNNNSLTNLSLNSNQALEKIECYDNRLNLSDLYSISEMINDENNKLIGTQRIIINTPTIVGDTLFVEQAEFNDIFTHYRVAFSNSNFPPFAPEIFEEFNLVPADYYTIDGGKIIFHKTGNYYLELTNNAISSHSNYPTNVIVFLKVISGVGVKENSLSNILIYPNPTKGELHVTNVTCDGRDIEIFDMLGRLQKVEGRKRKAESGGEKGETVLDISRLPAGIYFLKIDNQTVKIIKN
jgi:Leucine-rich repeat (LRR) protein